MLKPLLRASSSGGGGRGRIRRSGRGSRRCRRGSYWRSERRAFWCRTIVIVNGNGNGDQP